MWLLLPSYCEVSHKGLPSFKERVQRLHFLREEREDSERAWIINIITATSVKYNWPYSPKNIGVGSHWGISEQGRHYILSSSFKLVGFFFFNVEYFKWIIKFYSKIIWTYNFWLIKIFPDFVQELTVAFGLFFLFLFIPHICFLVNMGGSKLSVIF